MNEKKLIKEFNKLILAKYKDIKGIYLFGSRAKGNYKEDSDVDLVLLFEEVNRDKKMEIYGILSELMYKYDIFIDIHVMTPATLKFNPFFYEEVVEKGQFYAAA
jgi:uncharacterized protein